MNHVMQALSDIMNDKSYQETKVILSPFWCEQARNLYGWTENPPWLIEDPEIPRRAIFPSIFEPGVIR